MCWTVTAAYPAFHITHDGRNYFHIIHMVEVPSNSRHICVQPSSHHVLALSSRFLSLLITYKIPNSRGRKKSRRNERKEKKKCRNQRDVQNGQNFLAYQVDVLPLSPESCDPHLRALSFSMCSETWRMTCVNHMTHYRACGTTVNGRGKAKEFHMDPS